MAKGQNARKWGNIKDWWGKRPLAGHPVSHKGNKLLKRLLHKIERRQGKKAENG